MGAWGVERTDDLSVGPASPKLARGALKQRATLLSLKKERSMRFQGGRAPPLSARHRAEPERRGLCRDPAAYFPVGSSPFATRARCVAKIAAIGSTTERSAALVFDSTLATP